MTCPRSRLVYPGAVGVYHCVSSYVRRAYVCGVDRARAAKLGANVGCPNPPPIAPAARTLARTWVSESARRIPPFAVRARRAERAAGLLLF